MDSSTSAAAASVMIAIGVMTTATGRPWRNGRSGLPWDALVPDSLVAVRYVLRCTSPHQPRVVCVSEEALIPKVASWLREALRRFPHAGFICKTDDDSYVQTAQVHADLSRLEPRARAYGLVEVMERTRPFLELPRSHPRFGAILEQYSSIPVVRYNRSPFLMGAFWGLSRDLAALVPARMRVLHASIVEATNRSALDWTPLEDALVGYSLHEVAHAARVPYHLHHLTWTRVHHYADDKGGMGWVLPSAASTVVHWLKGGAQQWRKTHDLMATADTPRLAPFVFRWNPKFRTFGALEADNATLARWQVYRDVCGKWGCHAPLRGGDVDTFRRAGAGL